MGDRVRGRPDGRYSGGQGMQAPAASQEVLRGAPRPHARRLGNGDRAIQFSLTEVAQLFLKEHACQAEVPAGVELLEPGGDAVQLLDEGADGLLV